MKTKHWILLFSILLVICLGAGFFLLMPGEAATFAEIRSDGQLLHLVDLRIDQEFHITTPSGGSNTVTVKDGKIAVTEANCPDQVCVNHRPTNQTADPIVCLPNKLVVEVSAPDSENQLDGVS